MAAVHYHTGRFPPDDRLDWAKLVPFIGPATAAVARYDGMLAALPNPSVLLAPLTTREAVLSSRIEGTQATMGEVLEFEAGREPESPARRDDIGEVLNYRAAMRRAEEMLEELPLSLRVVREAHSVLMRGVRGEGKAPGEYRRTPNWIGPPGCTIDEAIFVPIGADRLPDAMSAWERYIHRNAIDRLTQLAILHAEFEALHPFLDGNGRLGRMLVPCSCGSMASSGRPCSTSAPTSKLAAMPTTKACSRSRATTTGPGGAGSSCRRCRRRQRTTWPGRKASSTFTTT